MSTLEALVESSLRLLLTLQAYETGFPKLLASDLATASTLSGREDQILELYDRLEQLKIETRLLEAQDQASEASRDDSVEGGLDDQIKTAEREVVEARAQYLLRKKITEGVITTDPSLRSVHAGENLQARERELLPRIHRRDLLSIAHTNLSSSLSDSSAALTNLETENILTSRKNVGLTKILLDLAEEAKSQDKEYIQDRKSLSQLEVLEKELQFRRSRWRTMKNVVSAAIAGSGIDWARDARLRQLVVDDEDEIS
ncbi:MAG: hypothetical protein M1840_001915 [Geoglossum simile]|nr:MAG: hypothetical protein M1840_001915 [Geoglossum simile]